MFKLPEGTSKEDRERLHQQFFMLLSKRKSLDSVIEAIDKYVVGTLVKEPPWPRPWLVASISGHQAGDGGRQMAKASSPYCSKKNKARVCCYASYADGVQNGFGPRLDGKVKGQVWNAKLSPMTVLIDGEQVR